MENTGIYIGFDISTSRIGLSIFDQEYNLTEIKCIELLVDNDVLLEHKLLAKANIFREYLQKYKENNILKVIIEDPLKGSNNQFTANMLMRFNGMCSYILSQEFNILPEFLTVHEWRSNVCPEFIKTDNKGKKTLSFPKDEDKKIYILQKISTLYPTIVWDKKKNGKHKDGNFDMADATGLVLGYFIKHNKLKLSL
jgi:hypothetical protein